MSVIALIGASSQLAKDLIRGFCKTENRTLLLYVRDQDSMRAWLKLNGLQTSCFVYDYNDYGLLPHDAVINFVGAGDPRRVTELGAEIFKITAKYDDLVMSSLVGNPERRYIFLSSGSVYGGNFDEPASETTKTIIPINDFSSVYYYAIAKLYAEVRHRAHSNLSIVDLRIFNIFSRTQSLNADFFITQLVRSARDRVPLTVSPEEMTRDYLHPEDLHQLIECILGGDPRNLPIDCFSRQPISKLELLRILSEELGLKYSFSGQESQFRNATGLKKNYYSINRRAKIFEYEPRWTSKDCVLVESKEMLRK